METLRVPLPFRQIPLTMFTSEQVWEPMKKTLNKAFGTLSKSEFFLLRQTVAVFTYVPVEIFAVWKFTYIKILNLNSIVNLNVYPHDSNLGFYRHIKMF